MRRLILSAIALSAIASGYSQDILETISATGQLPGRSEYEFDMAPDTIQLRDPIVIRELDEILEALPDTMAPLPFNPVFGPWIFSGYRAMPKKSFENLLTDPVPAVDTHMMTPWEVTPITPDWLRSALTQQRIANDFIYKTMVYNPTTLQYTYWDLPTPPRLPEDDVTLRNYIKHLDLPDIDTNTAILPEFMFGKKHWLHTFTTGLQFSQAYVSKNWYQGGNDYLALLYNFYWDVQLNPVYHPNELFQSTLQYKLGINKSDNNAGPHGVSLSEDLLQYNVKYGFKAFKKWFYTLTGQFKTQIFNNYKSGTDVKSASFLSPGDLNLGLGMTYSQTNKKKTFSISASIAPLSYNMKMCIDDAIEKTQFNIKPGHKTHSEFGSSGEMNMTWTPASNISMRTRCFAFTDYSYFQGNVETTWNFTINRFISTQIYANLRYDSSSDINIAPKWKHWMLKEILSFGLTYTFATKQ